MTVLLESLDVLSSEGIPVSVTSTAVVKISSSKTALRSACSLFLGMHEEAMVTVIRATLEGHQRSVISTLTVQDSYFKRDLFSKQLIETVTKDLEEMGLILLTHKVNQVSDSSDVIQDMLRRKAAEAEAAARAAEAEARKESMIISIQRQEEQELVQQRILADEMEKEADLQLKKLSNDVELSQAKASRDMQPHLEAAHLRQQLQTRDTSNKLLEAQTRVVKQDTELIQSLSNLVKGVLETNAQLAAKQLAATTVGRETEHQKDSEATPVVNGTKGVEAPVAESDEDRVAKPLMPAPSTAAANLQFGQQKGRNAISGEEAGGRHSHEVDDNYQTCPASPAEEVS